MEKIEQDYHIQNAYEAALLKKEKRELERYLRNMKATLPSVNPKPSDFEGCIE